MGIRIYRGLLVTFFLMLLLGFLSTSGYSRNAPFAKVSHLGMQAKQAMLLLAQNNPINHNIAAVSANAPPKIGVRHITFSNQCPYPVHFAFVGGTAKYADNYRGGSVIPCNHDADCPVQTRCNTDVNMCFWVMPKPADGNYKLAPGTENKIEFDVYDFGPTMATNVVWSGLFTGRKDCDGKTCAVADCLPFGGSTDCSPGNGAKPPATKAEFTFLNTVDYYDVGVINGIGIPTEMGPSSDQQRPLIPGPSGDEYWCGNPGAVNPNKPSLGRCNWNQFMPPSDDYIWVTAGGAACSSSLQCKQHNQMCGLSFNPGNPPDRLIQKTCGEMLGLWTLNEVCGESNETFGIPFNCSTVIQNGLNMTALHKCNRGSFSDSCYTKNAKDNCCGCVDWHSVGVKVPESTVRCEAINPNWTAHVLPKIKWIKQSCPTVYTYPFDDASSTFVCSNAASKEQINDVNYTVTFCPGGQITSLPHCNSNEDCQTYPDTQCQNNMCIPGKGTGCNAPGAPACPPGEICHEDGKCGPATPPTPPNECEGVKCKPDEYCDKGKCKPKEVPPSPPHKSCADDSQCNATVKAGELSQSCHNGACVTTGRFCAPGQACPGKKDREPGQPCPKLDDPIFGDPVNNRVFCPAPLD